MPERKHIPLSARHEAGPGRREVLQILTGAIGAGMAIPGLADGHPIQSHLADHATIAQADARAAAAGAKTEFLDDHQFKTLQVLAERIVPGASKAKTAEFIDQLLAVETHVNQRTFLSALGAFEARARELGRAWVTLAPAEQDRILTEASTMPSGMEAVRPWTPGMPIAVAAAPPTLSHLTLHDHFELIKGWIAGAYYSSEIGMRELGWTGTLFHAEFTGCTHPDGHR